MSDRNESERQRERERERERETERDSITKKTIMVYIILEVSRV